MSFLQEIQRKRKSLQSSTTIVTTATGERFVESKDSTVQPVKLESNKYGFIVDTKPDTQPACIIENFLYLGSQDAVSVENINQFKFTHILSIGVEMPIIENMTGSLYTKFLPCLDLPETDLFAGLMQDALKYIQNAQLTNGIVLVHCNAGVSRSASVVIAYLIKHCQMEFDDAYAYVKGKRACVQPNSGFLKQLKKTL